jgi:hypothetical protein
MKPSWKIIAAFAGIFIAGAIAGGFGALGLAKKYARRPPPPPAEQFGFQQMKKLVEQLVLTPEQIERIRPILTETGDDLRGHRREAMKLLERMEARVTRELTEEQRVRFAALQAREQDDRRKRWQSERTRRGEPEGAPASPTPPEGARPPREDSR